VYFLIGAFAALAAAGQGGAIVGREGAVRTIAQQPFGRVLLAITAAGLAGYALWRFVQAAFDPERDATERGKGTGKRLGWALSGIIHAAFAVAAVQLLLGAGGHGNERTIWLNRVLALPGGRLLVAVAGVFVVGVGVFQLYRAATGNLEERLELGAMSARGARWVMGIARAGLAARGVVFGIIGIFLAKAGLDARPSEARDVRGALLELAQQRYGAALLGVVAVGLAAYGLYSMLTARYRQMG
jgi:hypothetical protein